MRHTEFQYRSVIVKFRPSSNWVNHSGIQDPESKKGNSKGSLRDGWRRHCSASPSEASVPVRGSQLVLRGRERKRARGLLPPKSHTNHCHSPIQITASVPTQITASPPYKSLPLSHTKHTIQITATPPYKSLVAYLHPGQPAPDNTVVMRALRLHPQRASHTKHCHSTHEPLHAPHTDHCHSTATLAVICMGDWQ